MRRPLLILPVCFLIGSDRPTVEVAPAARPVLSAVSPDAALPTAEQFAELARTNPIECLRASLRKYQRECRGYHCTMQKQERLGNKLNPPELVESWFREQPYSVLLVWRNKPAGLADRVLFVEGANDNQMLAHPATALARAVVGNVTARDPEGREAKQGGRVTVKEFGMRPSTEHQLVGCEEDLNQGRLQLEYLGLQSVAEFAGRKCHMFRRRMNPPEGHEPMARIEFGLDETTWMQTVSIVHDPADKLLGAYYFRDVELNPTFPEGQFEKGQLLK